MDDYAQRFSGIGRLFGAGALQRLRAAHVAVVGLGGVGSWSVEALARSGLGAITLIDLDDVCVTNINRQLPALDDTVGRPKVAVLAERVARISPACRLRAAAEFFTAESAERLLEPRPDFVIDAVDQRSHKCLIIAACRERGVPVLTVGAAGGRRDPTAVRTGDLAGSVNDELLREVRRKLRRDHGFPRGAHVHFGVPCVYSEEKPQFPWSDGSMRSEPEPGSSLRLDCSTGFGTASFATGAFGFAAAAEVVRRIALDQLNSR
jgi:tRNA A37 threonylcarbamoyladenosine dehydratase